MYPNPQDVLPLPPRPSVEQYKKLAKDLVKRRNGHARNARWEAKRSGVERAQEFSALCC